MFDKKIFTVGLQYLSSPILFSYKLFKEIVSSHKKILIVLLSLIFFVLGLYLSPINTCDLNNYWLYIETYTGKNISEIWGLNYSNLYLIDFTFWVLANFLSKEFFSAICGFINFYIMFRICFSVIEKKSIKKLGIIVIILFGVFSINFPLTYSSGRNFCAIFIFMLALFREYYENKKNFITYLLYLIPIFIHETMIIYLIVRGIIYLFNKFDILKINLFFLLIIVLLPYIVNFSFNIVSTIEINFFIFNILKVLIFKAYSYFNATGLEYIASTQTTYYIVQRILYMGILLVCLVISNIYIYNKNENNFYFKESKGIYKLCLYSNIIAYVGLCFGLFVPGNIYCRYMIIPMMTLIIIIGNVINKKQFQTIILVILILYFLHFIHALYLFVNLLNIGIGFFCFLISPILLFIL